MEESCTDRQKHVAAIVERCTYTAVLGPTRGTKKGQGANLSTVLKSTAPGAKFLSVCKTYCALTPRVE